MRFLSALSLIALLALAACASDEESGIAEANSTVTVAYEGRLQDGTVFDQSDRATFSLTRVIPGFRDGIVGMRVGEVRMLTIPPEEAYGEAGVTDPNTGEVIIPPNATLLFEVELLAVD